MHPPGHPMDIQNIRAFMTVADTLSFSRAAEKLFLTQPAISKRIHALEASLDCKLFDRLGKRIHLTQAGRALLPGYRRILEEIEDSRRIVSTLRETVSGPLTFGTSHHIGLHRLPAVLQRYTAAWPDVELAIRFMDSEQAAAQILQGEIELALITVPEDIAPPLVTIPVWDDPMQCVVATGHALADTGTITPAALRQHGAILQSHGTHTRRIIDQALQIGEHHRIIMESNYLETIRAMIQHQLGWGVLPASMIDTRLHTLDVIDDHGQPLKMARHLGVLRHAERPLSHPAAMLLKILRAD